MHKGWINNFLLVDYPHLFMIYKIIPVYIKKKVDKGPNREATCEDFLPYLLGLPSACIDVTPPFLLLLVCVDY